MLTIFFYFLLHNFLKSQKASTGWEKSEEDEQILADLSSAYHHLLFSSCTLSLIVIVWAVKKIDDLKKDREKSLYFL